jgi:uncharacterized SAM-binding protein YcdF (DUF218 family)
VTYLLWEFVKPSHVLLALAVLGGVFSSRKWGRRALAAGVALLAACAVLPIAPLVARPLEERFAAPALERIARVDGIVVLAGAEHAVASAYRGEPQLNEHGDRLTTFLMLAQRFPEARLAHSGGSSDPKKSQSAVARTLILGAGVAPERIVFEDRAANTCESPRRLRELLAPASDETWLLVTSAAHMPRSMACFRAAGWEPTPYPADFKTGESLWSFGLTGNLRVLDFAAHEWVGLVYYRLRGYTRELLPAPAPAL